MNFLFCGSHLPNALSSSLSHNVTQRCSQISRSTRSHLQSHHDHHIVAKSSPYSYDPSYNFTTSNAFSPTPPQFTHPRLCFPIIIPSQPAANALRPRHTRDPRHNPRTLPFAKHHRQRYYSTNTDWPPRVSALRRLRTRGQGVDEEGMVLRWQEPAVGGGGEGAGEAAGRAEETK